MQDLEQQHVRLRASIEANLACSSRIDGIVDDVALAVALANERGDTMEDVACGIPRKHRAELEEARRAMDASLRRLNQRVL